MCGCVFVCVSVCLLVCVWPTYEWVLYLKGEEYVSHFVRINEPRHTLFIKVAKKERAGEQVKNDPV